MNVSLDLWTDAAGIFLFDPALFVGSADPADYESALARVRDGSCAAVGLQGDGTFVLRLTDDDLTPDERALLNETVGPVGVRVESGQLYASGMDLPGYPIESYRNHGAGDFVSLAAGYYEVLFHELRLAAVQRGLPGYVAVLRPRSAPFAAPLELPQFNGGWEQDDLIRRLEAGEA